MLEGLSATYYSFGVAKEPRSLKWFLHQGLYLVYPQENTSPNVVKHEGSQNN